MEMEWTSPNWSKTTQSGAEPTGIRHLRARSGQSADPNMDRLRFHWLSNTHLCMYKVCVHFHQTAPNTHTISLSLSLYSAPLSFTRTHTRAHTRAIEPHSTSEQLIITISCELTLSRHYGSFRQATQWPVSPQ